MRNVHDRRPATAIRGADSVGARPRLAGTPSVQSAGTIVIGDDFSLSSLPVVSHLVTAVGGRIQIGARVTIAHGAAITARELVRIDDDVYLGPFAMIMDTDFHEAGNHGSAGQSSPIVIEASAVVGARVTILRGAMIGAGARIAAGSVVAGRIPPGASVGGNPARPPDTAISAIDAPNADRVSDVIRRTLGLATAPALGDGPSTLPQWDSLGGLNLVLSLEEAFGVTLDPAELYRIQTVADFVDVVTRSYAAAPPLRL